MKSLRIASLIFSVILLHSVAAQAEIVLTPETQRVIPGVTIGFPPAFYDMQFYDVDLDGRLEALVTIQDNSSHVYDFEADSVIWSYWPAEKLSPALLSAGDVTGDSTPDLIIAENGYRNAGMVSYDSLFSTVRVFDGSNDWMEAGHSTHGYYRDHPGYLRFRPDAWALDFDLDGDLELLFSFDSSTCFETSCPSQGGLRGATHLYQTFPSASSAQFNLRLLQIEQLTTAEGDTTTVGIRRTLERFPAELYSYYQTDFIFLRPDGSVRQIVGFELPPPDTASYDDSCQAHTGVEILCVGDIDTTLPGEEALVRIDKASWCTDTHGDSSITDPILPTEFYIQLWHFDNDTTANMVWEHIDEGRNAGYQMRNAGVLSQYPGSFVTYYYNKVLRYDGSTGLLVDSSAAVGCGFRGWVDLFDDGWGRMVCASDMTASFLTFRLDTPTAIGDDEPGLTIPESFTLSTPYPNPFNPSVSFTLSLPKRADVIVEITNILGQRVAELYRGELPAGERSFTWDGRDNASGVYFIRVSAGEESRVQKALLVK